MKVNIKDDNSKLTHNFNDKMYVLYLFICEKFISLKNKKKSLVIKYNF